MKLYRVVPNTFSVGDRLDEKIIPGGEDIYYKMGYASFLGERGFHKYNNLFPENVNIEDGKYFFPFAEDAVREGYYLLTMSHKLRNVNTFYIVEYDFPADIVLQHFGFGDYKNDSGLPNPLMEIFVEKKNFTNNSQDIINTSDISKNVKKEILLSSFLETLKHAQECISTSPDDFIFYDEYFNSEYWQSFDSLVSNSENVVDVLERSNLAFNFYSLNGDLIKSPYLTGKIALIDLKDLLAKYKGFTDLSEYFQTMGIDFDVSNEQHDFKTELIKASGHNLTGEKDSSKVIKLLKERKYI